MTRRDPCARLRAAAGTASALRPWRAEPNIALAALDLGAKPGERSAVVTDAVIVATARTPIGRARKGSLVDVDAFELARITVGAVIERSGIAIGDLDDIVVAESLQGGGVIARNIAVRLGLTAVPGLADNRHCAAGLSAIQIAAASIRAGMDHAVAAGGTESLSTSPQSLKPAEPGGAPAPWMSPSHPETPDAP